MSGREFLDTNVLIYSYDISDPASGTLRTALC